MIPPTNKFTYTLVDTSIGDQYLNSRLVPNFIYPGSLNYTKSITFVNYIVKSFSVFVKSVMGRDTRVKLTTRRPLHFGGMEDL